MKKLGKLFRNLLIVCGVLFIIALLLPDEEENNPCHSFTIYQPDCIFMCGNAGGKPEQTDSGTAVYECRYGTDQ